MENTVNIKDKLNKKELDRAASMLRAIAHPVRITIIDLLEKGKRLPVKDIHESLNLEQAVASHHLGILRSKGVLQAERVGKNIFYSLKYERISQIIACIEKCTIEKS
ncbi:MAG: helix-turn-helix transcriptional regulator [Bacteroidia bacterium]|nr:helix-turn-helix transcriptional regulator [Bacteroidia bacterium]